MPLKSTRSTPAPFPFDFLFALRALRILFDSINKSIGHFVILLAGRNILSPSVPWLSGRPFQSSRPVLGRVRSACQRSAWHLTAVWSREFRHHHRRFVIHPRHGSRVWPCHRHRTTQGT